MHTEVWYTAICYDTCGAFSLFVYVWYVMVLVVSFRLYGNTVPVVCGLGAPHETKEGVSRQHVSTATTLCATNWGCALSKGFHYPA